jgi:hypothetical protein
MSISFGRRRNDVPREFLVKVQLADPVSAGGIMISASMLAVAPIPIALAALALA